MGLKAYFQKNKVEVACDEAGRGCLAGAVYAAAVILDPENCHPDLNDSKQLSPKKRTILKEWIENNTQWAIGIVDQKEIDEINILNASFLAMHRAIEQLNTDFDHLLIDGNRFNPYQDKTFYCIIKGDGKYQSIAAASILAKWHRDEYMSKLAKEEPQYGWDSNFGYPTKKHRAAIAEHGVSRHHRMSFQLLSRQGELNP